ncbi:MAG: hypothetical protein WA624_06155, partial [Methylocella sp.]
MRRLQVKFGCKYPYQQAADILNEFLPDISSFNHATTRNRVLAVAVAIVMSIAMGALSCSLMMPSTQAATSPSVAPTGKLRETSPPLNWHSPDNRECAKRVSLISCRDIGHSSYTGIIFRIARLLRLR